MGEMITPEEYLMDERVEEVLVSYNVPQEARERLQKLQQALYGTRDISIKTQGSSILEGILLFGSFTRGKLEPTDIDFIPFFDFSQYIGEEDSFRNMVMKANQTYGLIQKLGRAYLELGGTPHLEKHYFKEGYSPQCYINCTTDSVFQSDISALISYFRTKVRYFDPRFKPVVEHILGPQRIKEQFQRVLKSQ